MITHWLRLLAFTSVYVLLLFGAASNAQETQDVTFSTKYESGEPTTAHFYYNDKAIGSGREAFAKIVDSIGKLPEGTSVVWGPSYDRCNSCSNGKVNCVPKFLYPDLWARLKTHVQSRKLLLSHVYPGPNSSNLSRQNAPIPAAVTFAAAGAPKKYNIILDWTIHRLESQSQGISEWQNPYQSLSSGTKDLTDSYELEYFLDNLPERSKVLIQVRFASKREKNTLPSDIKHLQNTFQQIWTYVVSERVVRNQLQITLAVEVPLLPIFQKAPWSLPPPLTIAWHNYRSKESPHEEVIYTANDEFVGIGDEGFDKVMQRLSALPVNSRIQLPRYAARGAWAMYRFANQRAQINKELAGIAPYSDRKDELDAVIASRKLAVEYYEVRAGWDSGKSDFAFSSPANSTELFLLHGKIVRHDEPRKARAAKLEWMDFDAGLRQSRQSDSDAVYVLNDQQIGQGLSGFSKAMEHFAKLPAGSTVQVQVCLRTQAPFLCPVTYTGHRHFELTGTEPYAELLPWLLTVAKKNKLQIECLPDEQRTAARCELEDK